MEMLKKRLKTFCIGVILIFISFCVVVPIISQPCFHVHEETITRNLGWLIFPMDPEPVGRKEAWDSELPVFVQKDLDYAEAHGYDVEYEFRGNAIHLEYNEGEWNLSLKTHMDTGSTWDSLTNFSMYQTRDHKIILYGYTISGRWFQKITLEKNEARIDTITYWSQRVLRKVFLDGYDDSVIIPEEVTNLFDGKRVTTFEKMRETIYTIRKAYFDYYESRGDFVPAAPFFF